MIMSLYCTHCNADLDNNIVAKSLEIPSKPQHHYIACKCGNTMIGWFESDELRVVYATPTDNSQSTLDMVEEAKQLFKEAGILGVTTLTENKYKSKKYKTEEIKSDAPTVIISEPEELDIKNCDGKHNKTSLWASVKVFLSKIFKRRTV
jgi:hypothetical protein